MVISSRAVWAGRGLTLLQQVAPQFISACSSGHGQWRGPRRGHETASHRGDRRSPSQCGIGAPLAGSPRPATDPGDHHLGCPTDCRRHRRRHRPTAICGSSCLQCTDPPATDRPGREHGAARDRNRAGHHCVVTHRRITTVVGQRGGQPQQRSDRRSLIRQDQKLRGNLFPISSGFCVLLSGACSARNKSWKLHRSTQ